MLQIMKVSCYKSDHYSDIEGFNSFKRKLNWKIHLTYFFNVMCLCGLDHSPAVPIDQQTLLSCGFVTVNWDIYVALLVASLNHLKQ